MTQAIDSIDEEEKYDPLAAFKRSRDGRICSEEQVAVCAAPSVDDSRWGIIAEPLREFLDRDRLWPELKLWAKEQGIAVGAVRQLLAWLSFHDRIEWNDGTRTWRAV